MPDALITDNLHIGYLRLISLLASHFSSSDEISPMKRQGIPDPPQFQNICISKDNLVGLSVLYVAVSEYLNRETYL